MKHQPDHDFDDDYDDCYYDDGYCDYCNSEGFVVTCIDDLCRAAGECMHGDGETICPICKGKCL